MQNISLAQLDTVTGGAGQNSGGGGQNWFSQAGSAISNQWDKTKAAWSEAANIPAQGFSRILSGGR